MSPDPEFQKVIATISAFHRWSELASSTDLRLSDEHLQEFCCREAHAGDRCCSTYILIKCLEELKNFGGHLLVHVLAQHVGPFSWMHRIMGAVSEEGIESLHRKVKNEFNNISRHDDIERARIALQGLAVQTQLADLGKSME